MFGATAAIESQNVVGYQNKASLGGSLFKFVVPTFNATSGKEMTLKDIALSYAGDDASSQKIWTLDQGGATKAAYYYVNAEAADLEGVEVGWYTDTSYTTPANDVPVPFGQGFALVTADASTTVLFKGKVETAEFADVAGGSVFNFSGNFSPVDLKLQDVSLVYASDDASSQKIWTLDQGGATKAAYYYVNAEAADLEGVEVGWYTDTSYTTPANGVPLAAGDGFAVVAGSAIQLKVPAALK